MCKQKTRPPKNQSWVSFEAMLDFRRFASFQARPPALKVQLAGLSYRIYGGDDFQHPSGDGGANGGEGQSSGGESSKNRGPTCFLFQ